MLTAVSGAVLPKPVNAMPAMEQCGRNGPNASWTASRGPQMMPFSRVRHHFVRMNGLPSPYAVLRNPLVPTPALLAKGAEAYANNCASCHGPRGFGDGEAGRALSLRPSNVARLARMPMAGDGYLYWTIAEGGAALGSPMPAFHDVLTEEDIWNVIHYLRAGLPPVRQAEKP